MPPTTRVLHHRISPHTYTTTTGPQGSNKGLTNTEKPRTAPNCTDPRRQKKAPKRCVYGALVWGG